MHDVLDLEKFPIDQPGTPAYQALVGRCRADLAKDGMFNLEGFMVKEAVDRLAQGLRPRYPSQSFRHARDHNIYFSDDIDLPADHPAMKKVTTINNTLCADQLSGTVLEAIYEFPALHAFLAEVMNKPALYTMDDPLAGFNAMAYFEGQGLNWHFDRSEFTTTLLLQKPGGGGAFEYRPALRSADNPNYDGVADLLEGRDSRQRSMSVEAGTLNVFLGVNTAHRVTPVEGQDPRIVAVFTYYENPGASFTTEERIGFYGRAE